MPGLRPAMPVHQRPRSRPGRAGAAGARAWVRAWVRVWILALVGASLLVASTGAVSAALADGPPATAPATSTGTASADARAPAQRVTLPSAADAPAGRYLVDLPPGGGHGAPLLLALHGAASSPEALRAMTGLDAAAGAAGVAVVYPASAGVLWNDGRGAVAGFAKLTPRDDVAFLRAVVADAVHRFGLDAAHVSVVGLGSGGSMALELGCRAPDLARALVVVNASLWDDQQRSCEAGAAARGGRSGPSLLLLHGDADARNPWGGHDLAPRGVQARDLGVEATVAAWAARLGCGAGAGTGAGGGAGGAGGGSVAPAAAPVAAGALTLAHGCPGGTFVAAVRVRGAGGAWPRQAREVTVPGVRATGPEAAAFGPAAGAREAALDAADVDASAVAVAVAAGRPWQGLIPPDPHLTGPAPGRSFDVYAPPSYDPAKPSPLVLMLHGRGDSGYGMAALTRMNALADAHGFLVAYPESFGDTWNYYEGVPGVTPSTTVSDLAFFRRLVARLALDFDLDPKRLYIAGFSNGGFMAERAACGVSDVFAAFAAVSASLLPETVFDCDLTPTAPIVLMHGTADGSVPWNGIVVPQQGRQRYAALPVVQSVAFWTLRNACVFLPDQQTLPGGSDGATQVVRVRYGPCAQGRDVTFYGVQGGGHTWPGGAPVLPAAQAGAVTDAIDASSVIWSFFDAHPLDDGRNRPMVPTGAPGR